MVSIDLYPNGSAIVNRVTEGLSGGNGSPKQRGKIMKLTAKARAWLAFVVTETEVEFRSIATLTYGIEYPLWGGRVKADLNRFLVWYRRQSLGAYVWVLEFQARGAPHIHMLIEGVEPPRTKAGFLFRKEFAEAWVRAVKAPEVSYSSLRSRSSTTHRKAMVAVHTHPKAWEAIAHKNGAAKYMVKYCLKCRQKDVPANYQDVGRFYGWSRDVVENIPVPYDCKLDDAGLQSLLELLEHVTATWKHGPRILLGIKPVPHSCALCGDSSLGDGDYVMAEPTGPDPYVLCNHCWDISGENIGQPF